jgi:hypothetical protein
MALETALLIVPPKPVQVFSFPLRERYDTEAFDNSVPAHLTLLYPFVPPDQIEATVDKLKNVCADVPPFEVRSQPKPKRPGSNCRRSRASRSRSINCTCTSARPKMIRPSSHGL